MFDPLKAHIALDLCTICPVVEQCATDAAKWAAGLDAGVIAGQDRHRDSRGRPRRKVKIVKHCKSCEQPMYCDPGSTKRFCSEHCQRTPTPLDDVRLLRHTVETILARHGV